MSCSYSLVLVVSSAVAFPTVSMLTTPSTKSSFSRSSVFLLVFFFFLLQDALIVFCISAHQMQKVCGLHYWFFFSEIPLLLREEVSECKTHYSVNCLFKGILTLMLGSFLSNKNSMTCSLKVFYIQFPERNPNQQIKHFMQQWYWVFICKISFKFEYLIADVHKKPNAHDYTVFWLHTNGTTSSWQD